MKMGAHQSKPTAGAELDEKLIMQRVQALQLKSHEFQEDDYVQVEKGERSSKYTSTSTGLSISGLERWEHELLQDPKNRYFSFLTN